jgi:hypothetical protein
MMLEAKVLINPALENMEAQDLKQRYGEAWVLYNGNVEFVLGFVPLDDGKMNISLYTGGGFEGKKTQSFDYRMLNVARPPSQWYVVEDAPTFLCYPFSRQWSRGLKDSNCKTLLFPGMERSHASVFKEALMPLETRRKAQYKKLTEPDLIDPPKWKILTPQVLFVIVAGHGPVIFLRDIPIAWLKWYEGRCEVGLLGSSFQQEISEVIDPALLAKCDFVVDKNSLRSIRQKLVNHTNVDGHLEARFKEQKRMDAPNPGGLEGVLAMHRRNLAGWEARISSTDEQIAIYTERVSKPKEYGLGPRTIDEYKSEIAYLKERNLETREKIEHVMVIIREVEQKIRELREKPAEKPARRCGLGSRREVQQGYMKYPYFADVNDMFADGIGIGIMPAPVDVDDEHDDAYQDDLR